MTKLEELNMNLEKYLAIKGNLKNRVLNLEKNINNYKFEINKLTNQLSETKELIAISIFMIIAPFFITMALNFVIFDFELDIFLEQIIKVLLYSLPILNVFYEVKNIMQNKKQLKKLKEKSKAKNQDLFAEQFFLKNTKENIINNDKSIMLIKDQINNLQKFEKTDEIESLNNVVEKPKVFVKKIKFP